MICLTWYFTARPKPSLPAAGCLPVSGGGRCAAVLARLAVVAPLSPADLPRG